MGPCKDGNVRFTTVPLKPFLTNQIKSNQITLTVALICYISAVLGSEYCSGYFDSLKNWNNGFYCPSMEESIGN